MPVTYFLLLCFVYNFYETFMWRTYTRYRDNPLNWKDKQKSVNLFIIFFFSLFCFDFAIRCSLFGFRIFERNQVCLRARVCVDSRRSLNVLLPTNHSLIVLKPSCREVFSMHNEAGWNICNNSPQFLTFLISSYSVRFFGAKFSNSGKRTPLSIYAHQSLDSTISENLSSVRY